MLSTVYCVLRHTLLLRAHVNQSFVEITRKTRNTCAYRPARDLFYFASGTAIWIALNTH